MVLPSFGPVVVFITSVIFILSLTAFLVSCLCKASKEKNSNYGIEGQLKYTQAHSEVSKNEDLADNENEYRNRSSTINRQLPDIPKDSNNELIGNTSVQSQASNASLQLYEVVTESRSKKATRLPSLEQPSPSHHAKTYLQSSVISPAEGEAGTSQNSVGHPYAIVEIQSEHAYDKIHQATETSGESTDNYSTPHIYATSSNVHRQGSSKQRELSWEESKAYEYPPPVPEKMFDVADEPENAGDVESEDNDSIEAQIGEAGAAVAGMIPAADIPYMSDTNNIENEDTPSEGPYTSISVREPIANLRAAELLRQQERMTHVYTTVRGDEQDQTYAEIESTNQRKSSATLTRVTMNEKSSVKSTDDIPPDPPTVESLMSVTQAHSRQASDASSASHSVLSSPEASREKPFKVAGEKSDVPFSYDNPSSSHKSSATLPAAINLDELYAKVNKNKSPDFPKIRKKAKSKQCDSLPYENRRVFSMDYSSTDGLAPSVSLLRNSTVCEDLSFTSNKAIQEPNGNTNFNARNSKYHPESEEVVHTTYNIAQNLDSLTEPNYESLKKANIEPGYETIHHSHECDSLNDPEYETLQSRVSNQSDPGYECVWKLPDPAAHPCYSGIRGLHSSSTKDPNMYDTEPPYEGIKDKLMDPPYEGIIGDGSEPPYEGIEHKCMDPPYEGIKHNNEPPYEGIKHANDDPEFGRALAHVGANGPTYEGIGHSMNEPPYEGIHGDNAHHALRNANSVDNEPPYEGIKLPTTYKFPLTMAEDNISSSFPDDLNKFYEDDSDPMYEGIQRGDFAGTSNRTKNQPPNFFSGENNRASYPCSRSDSSEGEYERIKNNVEASDGSEPGYETVGNNYIEEPAYETLKPRKRVTEEVQEDDQTAHSISSSYVSAQSGARETGAPTDSNISASGPDPSVTVCKM